jgi:hypothetical protein
MSEDTDNETQDASDMDAKIAALTAKAETLAPEEPALAPLEVKDEAAPVVETVKAVETPAATKPATTEPVKPAGEIAATTESDHNRVMADLRIKAAELERSNAETRAELERIKSERVTAPAQREALPIPADRVFDMLVRANRGEYTNPGQNEQIRADAFEVIMDKLPSADVATVLRNALAGRMGEASAEIADLASKAMPVIQQREMQEQREVQERDNQGRAEHTRQIQTAIQQFPAYAKAETPEAKFLQEWDAANMGDGSALTPEVRAHLRSNPLVHLQAVATAYQQRQVIQAQFSERETKLQQEIASLKKRLNLSESPESPSSPVASTTTAGGTLEERLKAKYAEAEALSGGG